MRRRGLGLLCGGARLRGLRRRGGGLTFGDGAQDRARRDGLAFLHDDLGNDAGNRCIDLKRHFVGFKLGHGLVGLYGIACLLEPFADGSFGDGLAQRGDNDFNGHLHSLR